MRGWTADFFRFWWALLYWNARKSWFRLNGAHRDSCPCQTYSDSGLAFDARCDAVAQWQRPARFRKVCPLLVETQQGWRCSVNAESVRPFWLRAIGYGSIACLALYLSGTLALFAVLRAADYQIAYTTLAWPGRWPEFRRSQEQLHLTRAQQALASGNYPAALLSLQTVTQLNPQNYSAGLTLAHLHQLAGQADTAERIYERLMRDLPDQRAATARLWFMTLLARGDYERIKPLATAMLSEDSGQREAWLHALVVAARHTGDPAALASVVANEHGLPNWCPEVAGIEQLLLNQRLEQALPRLTRLFPAGKSGYPPYYQTDRLLRLGKADQAASLVNDYGARLPADEAAFLRLRAFGAKGWTTLSDTEYENLLAAPLSPRLATLFCAYLVEHADPARIARYAGRFAATPPPLTSETLPVFHASYLVARLGGATSSAEQMASAISAFTRSDAKPLHSLADSLTQAHPGTLPAQLLPVVALPIEVLYAFNERAAKPATR